MGGSGDDGDDAHGSDGAHVSGPAGHQRKAEGCKTSPCLVLAVPGSQRVYGARQNIVPWNEASCCGSDAGGSGRLEGESG